MGKYSEMLNPEAGTDQPSNLDSMQFTAPPESDFESDQKKYGSIDPRSDKAVDHKYWEDLLWNCWHLERPLYYTLHGIRCGGGELTLTKDSFRLLPGEWEQKEWEEIKQQYLDPVKDGLIYMLKLSRVGRVSEKDLPAGVFDTGMPSQEETAVMEQGSLFK